VRLCVCQTLGALAAWKNDTALENWREIRKGKKKKEENMWPGRASLKSVSVFSVLMKIPYSANAH